MSKETVLERINKRFRERATPEEREAYSFFIEILEKTKRNKPLTDREKEYYKKWYESLETDKIKSSLDAWNREAISTLIEGLDNVEKRLERIEKQVLKRKQ